MCDKNDDIKVSIIIPIYNVEKYLRECLDSVIRQTHKKLEIILVNDGSLDNCASIIEEYKSSDSRIVTIHKNNGGVSSARNKGIKAATGEYICFADSDDYLSEDYIQYLLDLITSNDADIAITKELYTSFDRKNNRVLKIEVSSPEKSTSDILQHKIPIGVYCKIFKKSLLDEYNISFKENIYIGEGFNFNTAAFQRARKIAVGNKRVYFYRTDNEDSAVTKFCIEKWENAFHALEEIENDLVINTKFMQDSLIYARWFDSCYVLSLLIKNKVLFDYPLMKKKCTKYILQYFYICFVVRAKSRIIIKAIFLIVISFLSETMFFSKKKV